MSVFKVKTVVECTFECEGTAWQVIDKTDNYLEFIDVYHNHKSHDDCHVHQELSLENGIYIMDEVGYNMNEYHGKEYAQKVVDFLNANIRDLPIEV